MSKKKIPYYLLMIVFLFTAQSRAQTYVSGSVSGVWTAAGNPYILVSDTVLILEDSTLTIEAGVEVHYTLDQQTLAVDGELITQGTEEDSVIFRGGEQFDFNRIYIPALMDGSLDINYTALYNCYVQNFGTAYSYIVRNSTILYGSIGIYGGQLILTDSNIFCDVPNTDAVGGYVAGAIIENCYLEPSIEFVGGSGVTVKNTVLTERILVSLTSGHFENNVVPWIWDGVYPSPCRFTMNVIGNTCDKIELHNVGNSLIEGNMVKGFIHLENAQYDTIRNNTVLGDYIYPPKRAFQFYEPNYNIVYNNILSGDYGIWVDTYISTGITNSYNDIYAEIAPYYNCNPGAGSIFIDPLLKGGDPFDYNLLCGSPAIDAGNPASPPDPDGTQADMGASYFDWSVNHPPNVFCVEDSVIYWIGEELSLDVMMYDDSEGTEITVEAPAWVNIDHNFSSGVWEHDSIHVGGIIPLSGETFTLQVIAEDVFGLTDTSEVYVFIYPSNYLRGSLSGVLDTDLSPYVVFENISLLPGDTLTIMPGVELQFMETGFDVAGKLICEGTEEDSIIFTTAIMEPEPVNWDNIYIHGNMSDSVRISYCRLEYGDYVVKVDTSYLWIDHCSFYHNEHQQIYYQYALTNVTSYGLVEYNYFDASNTIPPHSVVIREGIVRHNHISGAGKISLAPYPYLTENGLVAEYNLIEDVEDGISASNGAIARFNELRDIEDCGLRSVYPLTPVFYSNYLYNCKIGAKNNSILQSDCFPIFSNNTFEECETGFNVWGAGARTDTGFVYNNVFRNCQTAYRNTDYYDVYTVFANNCIIGCDTAFTIANPARLLFSYNDIYGCILNYAGFPPSTGTLVSVNGNGDSCDVNYNIYLEPMFGGGDPYDYHLCWGSPLIDAGNPDPEFNDPDSTINDIGIYGGQYGESYPYLEVRDHSAEEIPTKFSLTQNYPNPFNGQTVFAYSLPVPSPVTITITNVLGQTVRYFHYDLQSPGVYRFQWDGSNSSGIPVSNGIYIYSVEAAGSKDSKVMMMVK